MHAARHRIVLDEAVAVRLQRPGARQLHPLVPSARGGL